MFDRPARFDHLLPFYIVKQHLEKSLAARIQDYENRLHKTWLERSWAYLTTSYGEAGYLRTQKFIAALNKAQTTQEILEIIKLPEYQEGQHLKSILHSAAVFACGFNEEHINVFQADLIIAKELSENFHDKARFHDYYKNISTYIFTLICSSPDYGRALLFTIDKRLEKHICMQELAGKNHS